MLCLTEQTDGSFVISDPQPVEIQGCVYLLVSPDQLPIAQQMTMEDASIIATAFGLLLATGFIFRAVAQALKVDERYES